MIRRIALLPLAAVSCVLAQDDGDAASKVSSAVRRLAASAPTVPVFVIGTQQPQDDVAERWNAALGRQVEAEERAYGQLAGQTFVVEAALERARERRDRAVTALRSEIARNVASEVAPQQGRIEALLARVGASRIQAYTALNMIAAEVPSSAIELLAADGDVGRIVSNQRRKLHLDISTQAMHATGLWLQGVNGKGEAVGILDSGVRANHEMFQGKEVINKPFVNAALSLLDRFDARVCLDEKPETGEDKVGHGTHVAGIVASGGTRRYPTVKGVGSGVGQIYNLKIGIKLNEELCEPSVIILDQDWMAALEWAVTSTPVRIFNMSFGGDRSDDEDADVLVDQIADAYGAILVISAGNSGPGAGTVGSPGNAFNILSVASRDDRRTVDPADDIIADYSSRGPTDTGRFKPDIAAPGTRITSADALTGGIVDLSGTSMAAPHVAGAAALLCQAGVRDNIGLKALLINSADHKGWKADRGWGFANLARAVEMKDLIMRSELTPGRPGAATRYWRARLDKPFQATMVWNRHVTQQGARRFGSLRELDMYLHDRATGAVVAKSDSWNQNVEQLSTEYRGEVVLRVRPATPAFAAAGKPEKFAIAATQLGFEPLRGPALTVACQQANGASALGEFEVSCTARNDGDLPVKGVGGYLVVPVGFRSSGTNDFGELAAGGQAMRRFKVYPGPEAKEFFGFQANLTGASFGEMLEAVSQPLRVEVGGAAMPSLTAAPAEIAFQYRVGGPAPEPKQLVIGSTGGSIGIVAVIGAGSWLTTDSGLRGVTPARILLAAKPAGLPPGLYRGRVTVAASSAATPVFTVEVTLTVSDSDATVADLRTSKQAPAGCSPPAWNSYFSWRDERIWFWYSLASLSPEDRVRVDWLAPNGSTHASTAVEPAGTGSACRSASLELAGRPAAALYGLWHARVVVNDRELSKLGFFVSRVTVESWTLNNADPVAASCPEPSAPATSFTFSDPRVTAWLRVPDAAQGDRYEVTWFDPKGQPYHTQIFPRIEAAGPVCLPASLPIQTTIPSLLPTGQWTVVGYWNGALLAAQAFVLR